MNHSTQEPPSNKNQQPESKFSTPPVVEDKKLKLKWVGIGVFATLIFVGIIAFAWFEFQKNGNDKNTNRVNNLSSQTSSTAPTTTSSPIGSNVWKLSLTADEYKASSNLVENNLIYAVKNEYRSVVYKRNLQNGTQIKLFEFDESNKADKSGNHWSGLPPSIALSPNKREIVFIDQEGLKLYDIQSGNTKIFIRQTVKSKNPQWSIGSLNGTYNLAEPLFSLNGRYISFLKAYFEGSSPGLIDSQTEQYFPINLGSCSSNITWSPTETAFVKPMQGWCEGTGLFASASDITKDAVDLSSKFSKQNAFFSEANYSPDGKRLTFIFSDNEASSKPSVAIVNIDGSGFTIIDKIGRNSMPFFSSDSSSVFFVQQRVVDQVLVKYDLVDRISSDFAVLPAKFGSWLSVTWTKEGFLTIIGGSLSPNLVVGGDNRRMVILDIANKKVIYTSPMFDQFTNFAGLLN